MKFEFLSKIGVLSFLWLAVSATIISSAEKNDSNSTTEAELTTVCDMFGPCIFMPEEEAWNFSLQKKLRLDNGVIYLGSQAVGLSLSGSQTPVQLIKSHPDLAAVLDLRVDQACHPSILQALQEIPAKRLSISFGFTYSPQSSAHFACLAQLKNKELFLFVSATSGAKSCEALKPFAESKNLFGLQIWDYNRIPFDACSSNIVNLEYLKENRGLRILRIEHAPVSDKEMAALKNLTNLRELKLRFAPITDAGLANLTPLKNLRILSLFGCKRITDAGLASLIGLTELQQLDLGYTLITDQGLEHLAGLKNLRELKIMNTKITPQGLKRLKDIKELKIVR